MKNIIIGLDGATWKVLDRFINKGVMPNLAKLKEESVWGRLMSTVPPTTPSAWVSFMTGCSPAKTGVLGFTGKNNDISNTYIRYPYNSRDIKVPTIWDIISAYNKKVIAVNVPMTYPPWKINGNMITGMMTPSEEGVFTYPEELYSELKSNGIDYRIDYMLHRNKEKKHDDNFLDRIKADGARVYFDDLKDLLGKRMKAVQYLIKNKEWNYLMFVIVGMDRLQHHLWDYIENESLDKKISDNICSFYAQIDYEIGKITDEYNRDANIVLLSDHGFGKLNGNIDLNYWLYNRGYLVRGSSGSLKVMLKNILKKIGINPRNLSKKILGENRTLKEHIKTTGVNWMKTRAFSSDINSININMKDRETYGIVDAGDAEKLVGEIIKGLYEITDEEGNAIVKNVYRKEELYGESSDKELPDIIIEYLPDKLYSSPFRTYVGNSLIVRDKWGKGDHLQDGIFLMKADGIRKGVELADLKIEDLLPNILFMNDEKIPSYMSGNVNCDMFSEGFKEKHKPEYTEEITIDSKKEGVFISDDDKKKVEERLKSLGYL